MGSLDSQHCVIYPEVHGALPHPTRTPHTMVWKLSERWKVGSHGAHLFVSHLSGITVLRCLIFRPLDNCCFIFSVFFKFLVVLGEKINLLCYNMLSRSRSQSLCYQRQFKPSQYQAHFNTRVKYFFLVKSRFESSVPDSTMCHCLFIQKRVM